MRNRWPSGAMSYSCMSSREVRRSQANSRCGTPALNQDRVSICTAMMSQLAARTLLVGSVDVLDIQLRIVRAVRGEHDALPVRREDRAPVIGGIERQAARNVALHVVMPHVEGAGGRVRAAHDELPSRDIEAGSEVLARVPEGGKHIAATVHPTQHGHDGTSLVTENSGLRDGKHGEAAAMHLDLLDQRHRLAMELQSLEVERLPEQGSVAHEVE